MFLKKDRPALGRTAVALLAVVVLVVAAIGIYQTIGVGAPVSSTAASSNTSISSSTSTPTSTTSAPSSSVSSTAATTSSTSSAAPFDFALRSSPDTILISPGATLTYAYVNMVPLPSAQSTGSELVRLDVAVPSGFYLFFKENPVNVSRLFSQAQVTFTLATAQSVAPGDYKITVVGTSGSLSEVGSFTIRVTPYLIIAKDKVFSPANLTVKVGTTVYWIDLGFPRGGEDPEQFDMIFNTINVQSPWLFPSPRYDSFSYTFTTAGTYDYHCDIANVAPYMNGEIIVTG